VAAGEDWDEDRLEAMLFGGPPRVRPAALPMPDFAELGLLVDQQWNWRENQALGRRLENAKLRTNACVEDIDFRGARGLDKSVIRALVQESAWVGMHESVFVLGPTGVGKSFVACALAQKACRDGYSALYTRAQSLFRDLAMARADGSLRSLLARLSRVDVLVINDWAMSSLSEPERRDFWEICEDRYQVRSTILTLQPPLVTLARADRRSHACRRHPRPAGPQRPPHRDAWRLDAQESREAERIGDKIAGSINATRLPE